MSYLEELLPEFRKGAKIRKKDWADGAYLVFNTKDKLILNQKGSLCEFIHGDIVSNEWELYQEPIDWQYIIDHKCLCWFYDADESNKRAGILKIISENINVLYWNNYDQQWLNCRPVRRDEITFYEDKTNED